VEGKVAAQAQILPTALTTQMMMIAAGLSPSSADTRKRGIKVTTNVITICDF